MYKKDEASHIRFSHQNPEIKSVYNDFYDKPLSEKAEKMLHTVYEDKSSLLGGGEVPLEPEKQKESAGKRRFVCTVCGYIHETEDLDLPDDFECPVCGQGKEVFSEE